MLIQTLNNFILITAPAACLRESKLWKALIIKKCNMWIEVIDDLVGIASHITFLPEILYLPWPLSLVLWVYIGGYLNWNSAAFIMSHIPCLNIKKSILSWYCHDRDAMCWYAGNYPLSWPFSYYFLWRSWHAWVWSMDDRMIAPSISLHHTLTLWAIWGIRSSSMVFVCLSATESIVCLSVTRVVLYQANTSHSNTTSIPALHRTNQTAEWMFNNHSGIDIWGIKHQYRVPIFIQAVFSTANAASYPHPDLPLLVPTIWPIKLLLVWQFGLEDQDTKHSPENANFDFQKLYPPGYGGSNFSASFVTKERMKRIAVCF